MKQETLIKLQDRSIPQINWKTLSRFDAHNFYQDIDNRLLTFLKSKGSILTFNEDIDALFYNNLAVLKIVYYDIIPKMLSAGLLRKTVLGYRLIEQVYS